MLYLVITKTKTASTYYLTLRFFFFFGHLRTVFDIQPYTVSNNECIVA